MGFPQCGADEGWRLIPQPATPDTLVRLAGVDKRFQNGTTALQGLDLAVRTGEFLSLLGPSGCGKSTILRLISGLTEPTAGVVEWTDTAAAKGIGFVFQEPTLMPWASVLANVLLPLRLGGVAKATAREAAEEALRLVGLDGFAKSVPRELSGGMKMRVSIARALVTRPRILLMDEPFAALDEITRLKLNDDLLALWQAQGFTVVFVTHSVFESVYLSDRIVVMAPRPGRVTDEIRVTAAYPRRDFRLTPEYAALCGRVSRGLEHAMAA